MEDLKPTKAITFTICTLSMLPVMAAAAVAPLLGSFQQQFCEASELKIRLILTLPMIFIIPSSLLAGNLVRQLNKRLLLIIGLLFYSIGGLAGGWVTTIDSLLVCRAVLGIGIGIIFPLTTSLVSDFYRGEERIRMIGLSAALNNLGGVIATICSGFLILISPRAPFFLYLLSVIILIEVMLFLPSYRVGTASGGSKKTASYVPILPFLIGILLLNIIFYTVPSTTSMVIRELSLGGPVYCGLMLSIQNLCSFLAGANFKRFYLKLGKKIRYAGIGIITAGFLMILLIPNRWVFPATLILIGSGYGMITPYYLLRISNRMSDETRTFALSLASCSMFLGQFTNPVMISIMEETFGLRMPAETSLLLILPFLLMMGLSDLRDARTKGDQR